MASRRCVLLYVQHLLGIGHVFRALRIADALVEAGLDVHLVLGGKPFDLPPTRARLHQLPAIVSGEGGFSELTEASGRPVDEAFRAERRRLLLELYTRLAPDVLILEAFPFGRRQMRFELLPLLERARSDPRRPLIVSSVRDILQRPRSPDKAAEAIDLAQRCFHLVLVHGDPAMARLEDSFPGAEQVATLVRYTGLVGPGEVRRWTEASFPVVVSAGGGAVGARLLHAAVEARASTSLADAAWCLITGPNLPEGERQRLVKKAGTGMHVVRFVSNLPGLLAEARLSISQCGYNTVADILAAGCRSVVVPFATGGETEQTERAAKLERAGRAVSVSEGALNGASLASAIGHALQLPQPSRAASPKGAQTSASIILQALAEPNARSRAAAE